MLFRVMKQEPNYKDQWRNAMIDRINMWRYHPTFLIGSAMWRYRPFESCADDMAEYDREQYILDGGYHSAWGDGYLPDCQGSVGQSSLPNTFYAGSLSALLNGIDVSWAEYSIIPDWESYIGSWNTLYYDSNWGHFWLLSRCRVPAGDECMHIGIYNGLVDGGVGGDWANMDVNSWRWWE
jgi:hypothetical protein